MYITLCLKDCLLDGNIEQLTENTITDYLSVVAKVGGFVAMTNTDLLLTYRLLIILELARGPPQRFIELETYRLRALRSILCKVFIPVILALKESLEELSSFDKEELFMIGINIILQTVCILEKLEDFVLSEQFMSVIVNWLVHESTGKKNRLKMLEISAKVRIYILSDARYARMLIKHVI